MRPLQLYGAHARVGALRVGVLRRLSSRNGGQDLAQAKVALLRARAAAETARATAYAAAVSSRATADAAAVSARAAAETAAMSSRASADVATVSMRAATEVARSIAVAAALLFACGWLVRDLYMHRERPVHA